MTLDEKLRAYAAKGELVHLSLVATPTGFSCHFASASPLGGYARGEATDPIEAIEKAFSASPTRSPRASKPKADTATVIAQAQAAEKEGALRSDWTTP